MPEHYSKIHLEVSGPEGRAQQQVQFNVGVTAPELPDGGDSPGLNPAQLRLLIRPCELPDDSTIQRKGDQFISTLPKEPIAIEGVGKVARQLFGIRDALRAAVSKAMQHRTSSRIRD
jgi:hypothetical protein